ncbi:MAG: DUF222 domain-containing protein [Acidimicrobiales bacterium]
MSDEGLEDVLCSVSAVLAVHTARFLAAVGEYDARRAWEAWECHDMAGWLSWKCALSPVTAREQVRVARCLRCLPGLAERFSAGRLSYSQVRAITRAATPESVEVLADMAEFCTAAQLEAITRAWRRSRQAAQDAAGRRQAGRFLRYHYDDDGNLVGSFRLPAEAGAVFEAAIGGAVDRGDVDDAEVAGARDPRGAAAADALVDLVGAGSQAGDREGPCDSRYLLHVVVDADVLAHPDPDPDPDPDADADPDAERSQPAGVGGPAGPAAGQPPGVLAADPAGVCQVAGGPGLSAHTARRVACDATVVAVSVDTAGRVLDVGRKRRSVSRLQKLALQRRDGHCQYPGCNRTRTDAHHIVHWADGGPTDMANLISLCSRHHHLLHEDRYTIHAHPGGTPTFSRPDGRTIPAVPRLPEPDPRLLGPMGVNPYHNNWEGGRLDMASILDALHYHPPQPTTASR